MSQVRDTYRSFEHIELVLKATNCFARLVVMYRPPLSSVPLFFDELAHDLGHMTTAPGYFLTAGLKQRSYSTGHSLQVTVLPF